MHIFLLISKYSHFPFISDMVIFIREFSRAINNTFEETEFSPLFIWRREKKERKKYKEKKNETIELVKAGSDLACS